MLSTLLMEFSLLYWITEAYSAWIFSIVRQLLLCPCACSAVGDGGRFFVFVGFCAGIAVIFVYEAAICIFDYIPL